MKMTVPVDVEIDARSVVDEIASSTDALLKVSTIQQLIDSLSTDDIDRLSTDITLLEAIPANHPLYGVLDRVRRYKVDCQASNMLERTT